MKSSSTKLKLPSVVFVSCGSNLGSRKTTLEKAIRSLQKLAILRAVKVSSLYETSPVGGPEQGAYLNCLAEFKTNLSPMELLQELQKIEKRARRTRVVRWEARTLDLDIVSYEKIIQRSQKLTLPHPRYHQRRFVLVPFHELAPRFIHPRLRRSHAFFLRKLTLQDQRVTMLGKWTGSRFSLFKKRKK